MDDKAQCNQEGCEWTNSSGNEADLNFHLSQAHPKEWKYKQERINKAVAKEYKKQKK